MTSLNSSCTLCDLHEDCQSICLHSEPQKKKVMIVAEKPMFRDDQMNTPFSSKSFQYLTNLLAQKGMNLDDTYCTYVVKCRPYDDVEPTKEQVKTCFETYFADEFNRVLPDLIITLGNTPMKMLTGRSGIMNWRGQELNYRGVLVIPTISPAAVMRNPRNASLFNADLDLIVSYYKGNTRHLNNDDIQIHYVMTRESFKDLLDTLDNTSFITYDIETEGFDYWKEDKFMLTISISTDENTSWVVPLRHNQSPWRNQTDLIMKMLSRYFDRESLQCVSIGGWNGKFDDKWMKTKYGIDIKLDEDGMLACYACDENTPNGLKPVARTHFKSGNYDADIQFTRDFDLKKLMKYNGLDTIYTYRGIKKFVDELKEDHGQYKIYRELLMRGSDMFQAAELEGVYIVPENVAVAKAECQAHMEAAMHTLMNSIPTAYWEKNLHGQGKKGADKEFNWNSPKQIANLFYIDETGLRLPILKETDTGNPSTDESTMLALREEFEIPVLENLLIYRKWAKYMSTYIDSWAGKVDKNNKLHTSFKLHGTVTGRLSADDGIHQVPRDTFIRQLVGAPPGWIFVEADQSQMELRLVAHESLDPVMVRTYCTGGDIHRGTAAEVTGKREEDVTKDDRKKAKAVNFGFVYGMGAPKFKLYAHDSYGVHVTIEEAREIRAKYFARYKGLRPWHEKRKKMAHDFGYVRYADGRVRHLPDIYSSNDGVRADAERQAINSPIQGFGSDIVLYTLIKFYEDYVKDNWDEIHITGSVHDAGLFEVREDVLNKWLPIIKREMENIGPMEELFGFKLAVPIEVEVELGHDWGHKIVWEPGTEVKLEDIPKVY